MIGTYVVWLGGMVINFQLFQLRWCSDAEYIPLDPYVILERQTAQRGSEKNMLTNS